MTMLRTSVSVTTLSALEKVCVVRVVVVALEKVCVVRRVVALEKVCVVRMWL